MRVMYLKMEHTGSICFVVNVIYVENVCDS